MVAPRVVRLVEEPRITAVATEELREPDFMNTVEYEGIEHPAYGVAISRDLRLASGSKKLCGECGKRAIEPMMAPGRRSSFRNLPALEVPDTLGIPTCSDCGAEWIDRETARKTDEALAARGAAVLADVARQAIEALSATMSQRELEATLGPSAAYLSKLRHGKEVPSAPLVALLSLLAARPARIQEVERVWATGQLSRASSARTSRERI